jgi:hypothetical protein
LRRTLMLFAGDGGKYDGVESLSGLFTSFLAPSVPGQRSSTSLGGVIGRASLTPENWSISAIFSMRDLCINSLVGRSSPVQSLGCLESYLRGRVPYQRSSNRGYVAQCINVHLRPRFHTASLPPVSIANSSGFLFELVASVSQHPCSYRTFLMRVIILKSRRSFWGAMEDPQSD